MEVTGATTVAGQRIVRVFGYVHGLAIRDAAPAGPQGAGAPAQSAPDAAAARADAMARMCRQAAVLGANAVVSVQYDYVRMAYGVGSMARGAAVQVEPA